MTQSAAEKAVVIARRRKKHAMPGMKQIALARLRDAVTFALAATQFPPGHPRRAERGPRARKGTDER